MSAEPLETAAWRGTIARPPTGGEVEVRIPALGGSSLFGPCPYTPHPTAPVDPQEGDRALVLFDDRGDPWVVMWTDG